MGNLSRRIETRRVQQRFLTPSSTLSVVRDRATLAAASKWPDLLCRNPIAAIIFCRHA
jgi:hypothetical protein